ncbi:MAG: hypothetical protein IT328_19095 [Caldilineaceae bacterium]|nr:hypothetical protein [Caldilineaceae bacterium]
MNRSEIKSTDPVVEETGDLANLVDQVAKGHTLIVVTRDGEPIDLDKLIRDMKDDVRLLA